MGWSPTSDALHRRCCRDGFARVGTSRYAKEGEPQVSNDPGRRKGNTAPRPLWLDGNLHAAICGLALIYGGRKAWGTSQREGSQWRVNLACFFSVALFLETRGSRWTSTLCRLTSGKNDEPWFIFFSLFSLFLLALFPVYVGPPLPLSVPERDGL